jgi:hypothetical protein
MVNCAVHDEITEVSGTVLEACTSVRIAVPPSLHDVQQNFQVLTSPCGGRVRVRYLDLHTDPKCQPLLTMESSFVLQKTQWRYA